MPIRSIRQAQDYVPGPGSKSLTDLVFGLALSIGAIILIGNKPVDPKSLFISIAGFGFSFLILIRIWFRLRR